MVARVLWEDLVWVQIPAPRLRPALGGFVGQGPKKNMDTLFSSTGITPQLMKLIYLSLLWVFPWKAVALWKSARNNHRAWFITLLVLNTMAILEITYIFYFGKKKEANKEFNAKME